ncbi:MAG: glycoside hydrolase family 31 protein [Planctomycetota bacterium]
MLRKITTLSLLLFLSLPAFTMADLNEQKIENQLCGQKLQLTLEDGEKWWGGFTTDGKLMPFGSEPLSRDLYGNNQGNQVQPLLISNMGRFVWSEQPYKYTFGDGKLNLESEHGDIITGSRGKTLREVFLYVSKRFFPSNGKIPDPILFTNPQYNTWIELMYDQREDKIRKYANDIIKNGFPPGVLMIDDNWQEDYGNWDFHPERFKKPKDMIDSFHAMGFKVMLWICPYISPDMEISRFLERKRYLLRQDKWNIYICKWWNGYSGVIDLTKPQALEWFKGRLDYLQQTYGVDGFKFDGADTPHYKPNIIAAEKATPNRHTELWALLGTDYPLNEYRACWKAAGLPLAQRLRDKSHSWSDLQRLMPDALALGLMGYAYVCPDLIGGGEFGSFLGPNAQIDQELIVRYAQCSALMPMMQFSVAPWRVLDKKNQNICLQMAKLHMKMGNEILALARASSKTGEPIISNLEYMYPHRGYENVKDQFMLGKDILVAPVVEKDKKSRNVLFPEGTWLGDDGSQVTGPCKKQILVPIERLPWYRLK